MNIKKMLSEQMSRPNIPSCKYLPTPELKKHSFPLHSSKRESSLASQTSFLFINVYQYWTGWYITQYIKVKKLRALCFCEHASCERDLAELLKEG
jgi:hypothetical protein